MFLKLKNIFGGRSSPSEKELARSLETSDSTRVYHYRRENEAEKSRIHLRLDPDGHGTLIVNANRILHLNPTAALMAYFILEGTPEAEAVRLIRRQYHVGAEQARADLGSIRDQLEELVRPDGACPIHD